MMVMTIKKLKKQKKKCVIKKYLSLKSQERFKSEAHYVYTKEINNIVLSRNDDKRLQTFDRITSYPYGASAEKVWKT